jgi:protein SCO1/2
MEAGMRSRTLPEKLMEGVLGFFSGARFPAFLLSVLVCYELLVAFVLLTPSAPTGFGAFAEEFRIWCFGYDPATGGMNPMAALSFLVPPVLMAAGLVVFWFEPLRAALERPWRMVADFGAGAATVAALVGGFLVLGVSPASGELPFPAETLRVSYAPPDLGLVDQNGERVDLAALRGDVVILTAVYASCPHTCPVILDQARAALDELTPEERARVHVVGVTLDPSHDTPAVMNDLASRHGLEWPTYRLVTGPPAEVERVLDRMDVARQRNAETGVIDHANLFLVIDPAGRIAYRLTIGERQQRWLVSALRLLAQEARHGV